MAKNQNVKMADLKKQIRALSKEDQAKLLKQFGPKPIQLKQGRDGVFRGKTS